MEFWKASKDIQDLVAELVAKHHPDLALVLDQIVVVFKEKAGTSGGQVVLGTASKSSALMNALSGENYQFILTLGSDQWENSLTGKQREALLDSLLCACRAEEDPKTGDPKCVVARPDIIAFRENLERYGMWFPVEESEKKDLPPVDEIAAMFGAKQ